MIIEEKLHRIALKSISDNSEKMLFYLIELNKEYYCGNIQKQEELLQECLNSKNPTLYIQLYYEFESVKSLYLVL